LDAILGSTTRGLASLADVTGRTHLPLPLIICARAPAERINRNLTATGFGESSGARRVGLTAGRARNSRWDRKRDPQPIRFRAAVACDVTARRAGGLPGIEYGCVDVTAVRSAAQLKLGSVGLMSAYCRLSR